MKINIKTTLKNTSKKILNFNYKDYINTSILGLVFIITNLLNSTLLRFLTIKDYFVFKPIIADLAFLLFVASASYLFKPKQRSKYFIIWSIILTAICIIDSMYYTFFMSFSSISLLATSVQVVDVGDAIIKNVIEIKDLLFLWQPIFIIFIHKTLKKGKYYDKEEMINYDI